MSLLMMESDDDKDHFDYKEIVKNETKKSKKKRNKAKRDEVNKLAHFYNTMEDQILNIQNLNFVKV